MLKRMIKWLTGTSTKEVRLPTLSAHSPRTIEPQPDITSLPRTQRLFIEQQVLAQRFPSLRWQRDGEGARIEGAMRTTVGRSYEVRLLVPSAFPFAHPKTFILSTIEGNGCVLTGTSHAMHTLSPDSAGHPQLCLYNDRNWNPSLTLHHVLVKAAVWLEAFEQHRRTGRPISDFLANVR